MVGTIYSGFQIRQNPESSTDFLLDIESAGGRGLGEALGVAGFMNLDVVRNPNVGSLPYIARIQLHQIVGLSDKTVEAGSTISLATLVPERRIELRIGKLSTVDLFDKNGVGTDSHLQFMNWTIDNAGSYDYGADTRGYTYGAFSEYDDKAWSIRYMLALMPMVANGLDLDWNLHRSSGQNMEFELRKAPLGWLLRSDKPGTVRILSFVNHAHMGLYADAILAYLDGVDSTPTITLHEKFGAVKYGFGFNAEQLFAGDLRGYVRAAGMKASMSPTPTTPRRWITRPTTGTGGRSSYSAFACTSIFSSTSRPRRTIEDHQDHRRNRLSDQHSGSQCSRRGGARGRIGHGLRLGGGRSAQSGAAERPGRERHGLPD